jgi:RNA polymerase sigma-70 factor, ECF subfamily
MTSSAELTDDALLRRMIAGDEEAFTLLYRRKQPAIYRFALMKSRNTALAEDVTQEVFMALIRDARRFDPTRGTLGGYLFGMARNHLRKRWEQDRRLMPLAYDADEMGELEMGDSATAPGGSNGAYGHGNGASAAPFTRDEFSSIEATARVRQAISTLPDNYREVVALCELEEMSYEEAASALGCPVGTVRSRLHRARAILVEKLRDAQPPRRAVLGERER